MFYSALYEPIKHNRWIAQKVYKWFVSSYCSNRWHKPREKRLVPLYLLIWIILKNKSKILFSLNPGEGDLQKEVQGWIQQFVWLVPTKIKMSHNKTNLGNWCWINVNALAYLPAMFPSPPQDWPPQLSCFFSTMADTKTLLSNIL